MGQLSNFKNPRWRCTRTAVARNSCVSWAFLYYYSAQKLILIYHPMEGRRLCQPGIAVSRVCACVCLLGIVWRCEQPGVRTSWSARLTL